MEKDENDIIVELMQALMEKMGPGEDDLHERLGRPKPEMAKLEIEAHPAGDEMPMGDDQDMGMEMEESPEDKLKSRLMKIRG